MISIKDTDRHLILSTLFLVAVGVLMVYSTSFAVSSQRFGNEYIYLKKQFIFALMGIVLLVGASRFPYKYYYKLTYPLLVLSIIGLALLYIPGIGQTIGGARRWVSLGGFSFQPSEPAKAAVVLFLAYSLSSKEKYIEDFYKGFLPNIIIPGVVILMILGEPDLGTAVSLSAIVLTMCFVAGVRVKYIFGMVLLSLPFLYFVISNFAYMQKRLEIFLDPWADPSGAGFQMVQSFIAFGSGGLFGVGFGEGKQKLFYLPEAHTDFIFSIVGEELGLIGVLVIVALYIVFLISGFRIAFKAKDRFGMYLAFGLTTMITLQAILNMAVVLGILPPKGLPLPFISYGGTSMLVNTACVGVILNIYITSNEDT